MAYTIVDDSATIGTAEYSLPGDTSSGVPTSQTDDSLMCCWIDFGAMALGDEYEWKIYEKINGTGATQRTIADGRINAAMISKPAVLPSLILVHGWDITVKKIGGTDRSIGWSLRKITGLSLTIVDDSATISTTEYSLPNDGTTLTPQTDDALLQAFVDFGAMATGDVYEWKLYEKVNGTGATQRVVDTGRRYGAQTRPLVIPLQLFAHGWDLTVKKISGTDRSIGWSLRKIT